MPHFHSDESLDEVTVLFCCIEELSGSYFQPNHFVSLVLFDPQNQKCAISNISEINSPGLEVTPDKFKMKLYFISKKRPSSKNSSAILLPSSTPNTVNIASTLKQSFISFKKSSCNYNINNSLSPPSKKVSSFYIILNLTMK